MSVRALTSDAAGLLGKIKRLIDQGHVTTWQYDSDGDFTHTPSQWLNKGWLKPHKDSDRLRLNFVAPTSGASREVFAVYQGRFIEMLVKHVPDYFTDARATPNPDDNDSSNITG